MSPIAVEVTVRGEVSHEVREQAREKLERLEAFAKGPILGARVVLIREANPRIATPARAEAEISLQGRLVRARAAAPTMAAAVDDVAERLQRHLRRYIERLLTAQRKPTTRPPGEWSHHAWSPPRPPVLLRAVEERRIVRRKSFAFDPMSVAQAVDALEDLDHDFFLFHDGETGVDAVVYWRDDGQLGLIEPPSAARANGSGPIHEASRFSAPIGLDAAIGQMDALNHRFLFFEDRATGRGSVIYRRYDGHYGLIEPA